MIVFFVVPFIPFAPCSLFDMCPVPNVPTILSPAFMLTGFASSWTIAYGGYYDGYAGFVVFLGSCFLSVQYLYFHCGPATRLRQ